MDFFDELPEKVDHDDEDDMQEIVDWIRDMLQEEYSGHRRDDVIEILERELDAAKKNLEDRRAE